MMREARALARSGAVSILALASGVSAQRGHGQDHPAVAQVATESFWVRSISGPPASGGFNTGSENVTDGAVTSDGAIVVAGFGGSFGSTDFDAFVVKLDADGDTIWCRVFRGPSGFDDRATGIAATPDGGLIVVGSSISSGSYPHGRVWKLDAEGAIDWQHTVTQDWGMIFEDVVVTSGGHSIVVGSILSAEHGTFAWKLDADGVTAWQRLYTEPSRAERASRVVETTTGNLAILVAPLFGSDQLPGALKMLRPDGQVEWKHELAQRAYGDLVPADQGGVSVLQSSPPAILKFRADGTLQSMLRFASNWPTLAALKDAGLQHVVLSPFYGISPDLMPKTLEAVEELLERFISEAKPVLPTPPDL